jgi:3-dehydroquinate dehydratase
MNDLARFHDRLDRRSHRARHLRRLLRSVGVEVPRHYGRRDMTRRTYAVGAIQSLCDTFGEENVRLAIRLLVETTDQNARCLHGSVITALTIIVAKHAYGQLGLALFDAMDQIDVGALVEVARTLKHRRGDHESHILLGLITAELRRNLGGKETNGAATTRGTSARTASEPVD